jgi:tRNA(Arg) A34 adenosine deaminase TadA
MENGIDQDLLCDRLLEVILKDIVPKTQVGVELGNKIFGAAILRKSDLSLVAVGTNQETKNPLLHGEISTLNLFYDLPRSVRPKTQDCLFLSTHEPCSLCLSAITWTGFDNFYYFFGYEETKNTFNIPHDLKILDEVFDIPNGAYVRKNHYWRCHHISTMVSESKGEHADLINKKVYQINSVYEDLSQSYQITKNNNAIPLS